MQMEERVGGSATGMAMAPQVEAIAITTTPSSKPISTILIYIAMHTEALPLVEAFQLSQPLHSVYPEGVPWVRYHGVYNNMQINIVQPGKDPVLGVDSVGTITASLVTYASVLALQPDLIINAGTAGGFKAKGAAIGDMFLASEVAFHDRRIPLPAFDVYGVGLRQACSTSNLVHELKLKTGKLSTGDSLEMSPHDEASISSNEATVKDMEGAAVAYVAELLKVPIIFLKAVTDIVDGDNTNKPTSEEFAQNLTAATTSLASTVANIINFIHGKSISDL